MKIIEVSRGHILVQAGSRHAKIQGEMFFPPNDKMGFVIFSDTIQHWDSPDEETAISQEERDALIQAIQQDFQKGGNVLEVE